MQFGWNLGLSVREEGTKGSRCGFCSLCRTRKSAHMAKPGKDQETVFPWLKGTVFG